MLKIIFNQVVKRLFPNRSMQSLTKSEILRAENEAIQIMNRTKGKTGEVIDLTGRRIDTSQPIMGGKNVESINNELKRAEFLKKYTKDGQPNDVELNALVNEYKILSAEAKKLGDAGENYGKFSQLNKRTDEIEEILDFMNKEFPPEGMASGGLARVGYVKGKIVKGIIGQFTKAEVLIQRLKNTIKGSKDPYVQENFPNFIKEITENPKLANDPNVWKELGGDLPYNQRLIVHSDDSVTFQTRKGPPSKLSKPTKTLEGIKKKGTIDISDPEVADEFSRFMKESDPEGFKDLEQKIEIGGFDVTGRKKNASGGIAGQLHLNEGGRVPMIFGGSAGLKAMIASIKAGLNKGRTEKIKTLFPKYSADEKELLKLGEKYLPKDSATLAAKEIEAKAEGIQVLIDRLKHDKKLIAEQAKNKAKNDPSLDFLMESLEKTMPEAYGPHLKKYTNIDKDILQLETIKKNLIMKDRKLNAEGGRASLSNGGLANILGV